MGQLSATPLEPGDGAMKGSPQRLIVILACFALSSVSADSLAENIRGQVVGVRDGDTIEVLHNHRTERIRLNGIDCPKKGQPYAAKAKQATADLVLRKEVSLHTHGRGKSGELIAEVTLPDGVIVNLELVRNGSCWWYPESAPENVILAELQRRARRSKLGLWADPHPVPPWEWRKQK